MIAAHGGVSYQQEGPSVTAGGGPFDIGAFFADHDEVDLSGAGWWLDHWLALAPPGRRLTDADLLALRDALDESIATNRLGRRTAAHLMFLVDFAEAVTRFETTDWNAVVLAYAAQVRLTDDEWRAALASIAGAGTPVPDATTRLRAADLPATLLVALYEANGLGALRELTHLVRSRCRQLIIHATTGRAEHDDWLVDLALLGVTLEVRRFFPVSREAPRGPVASRPASAPTAYHRYAETLFAADEIAAVQEVDAELDRCEGDLVSAVTLNLIDAEGLRRLGDAFTAPAPPDERAVRRAQLRSLRDRFRLPPVQFEALDRAIRACRS